MANNIDELNNESSNDEIDYKEVIRSINRKKKWGITSGLLLFTVVAIQTIQQRIVNPTYQGSFSILISDPFSPNKSLANASTGIPSYQNIFGTQNKYDKQTLTRLLKSPVFLENIAKDFGMSPNALSNSITIKGGEPNKPLTQDGFLDIKLRTKNREKGIRLMNVLSESFLKESLVRKEQKLYDGLKFLNDQYPRIKKEKEILQQKLVSFRKKNNLIDPLIESQSLKARKIEAENMITSLNTFINRLKNVRLEIINGTMTASGFSEQIGQTLGSEFVVIDFDQGILSQLISLEKEIANAKLKFTSESSFVKGLEKRRQEIEPFLLDSQLESVDTAIKLTNARLSDTFKEKINLEKQFLKYPILIKEYQEIVQKLNYANENLLNLNAAINNFELELAQSSIPWKIISSPRMSPVPIKPNIPKTFFNTLIISLLFGILISFIRDRLDNVFHSPKEVDEDLKFPLLGNVPFFGGFKDVRESQSDILSVLNLMDDTRNRGYYYENFYISEALRNIYTSIRFLNSEKPLKTLIIASSIPKEGKSLINILLSKIFCDMGERVLLIDTDLRKPQIHERLSMNNLKGLSDYLVNNQTNLNDVIQTNSNIKNLNVITSGSKVPDPPRLINSQRFELLVEELNQSKDYDCIIFDSPPMLGLSDSLLISQKVDGLIMLITLDFVNKSLCKEAIKRFQNNKINLLGLITNSIKKPSNKKVNSFDSYYNYTQGYGYQSYLPSKEYANNPEEILEDNVDNEFVKNLPLIQKLKDFIKNKYKNLSTWLDS